MGAQRRGKGEGSFWQDKHGQWWAKAERDGRRLRARASSRAEARAKAKELAEQLAAGTDVSTARLTIQVWLSQWIEIVAQRVKPSTLAFYKRHVEYCIPHIGKIVLGRLDARHVEAMLAALGKEGLSPQSVAHVRSVLANSLETAIRYKARADNPARQADAPRVEPYEAHALTSAEQVALLAAVEGVRRMVVYGTPQGRCQRVVEGSEPHRLATIAHIMLDLGLRRGEALGLTWDMVDLARGTLRIIDAKTPSGYRTVPMTAYVVERLRQHRAAQDEEALVYAKSGPAGVTRMWNPGRLVFCSEQGTRLSESNFTARVFKMWLRWAGLPAHIRPHDLRHTAITGWITEGADPRTAQALAGHADPQTTMRIYAHAQAEKLRPAVEAAARARRSA